MEYVKTAISVPRAVFEEAEAYAAEHSLSRSRLVTKALEDYLYRQESKRLLAAFNEVYGEEPTPEDLAADEFRRELLHRHLLRLDEEAGEPW